MVRDRAKIIPLQEMPTGGSDIALKRDVKPIGGVLDKVLSLRPVRWRWKVAGKHGQLRYGFIAQEVEELFPDLVTVASWEGDETVKGDGTMRKHIATTDLMPYLVGAVIEQQKQIKKLEKQIASMQKHARKNQ